MHRFAYLLVVGLVVAACGGTDTLSDTGIQTVDPQAAQDVIDSDRPGLVVLDVRTPEEFAEGHIDGAVNVDFYAPDFADQLAALDPDVPYVLYCRSGNRSGTTVGIMEDLEFQTVYEVDGGILAWESAGLSITR